MERWECNGYFRNLFEAEANENRMRKSGIVHGQCSLTITNPYPSRIEILLHMLETPTLAKRHDTLNKINPTVTSEIELEEKESGSAGTCSLPSKEA